MLGLFIAVAIGFVRARGEDAGAYLIMMAFFYSAPALFLPRVTVTIRDLWVRSRGASHRSQCADRPGFLRQHNKQDWLLVDGSH